MEYEATSQLPRPSLVHSTRHYISPRDLLSAFTGPECNERVVGLLGDMAGNPLLRFRIFDIWTVFHQPKLIGDDLLKSRENIVWHLNRIYRARNLTVHLGRTPDHASALVNHAQYYFARTVSRVLSDLTLHKDWTVHVALENQRRRFTFVTDTLNTHPDHVPGALFFPNGDEFVDCFPWRAKQGS